MTIIGSTINIKADMYLTAKITLSVVIIVVAASRLLALKFIHLFRCYFTQYSLQALAHYALFEQN